MRIVMVLTSHDLLGNTGRKTGFWLEEFAAPYFVFRDAGVELTRASPKGGQPPLDPKSDLPESQTPQWLDSRRMRLLKSHFPKPSNLHKLSDVKSDYLIQCLNPFLCCLFCPPSYRPGTWAIGPCCPLWSCAASPDASVPSARARTRSTGPSVG